MPDPAARRRRDRALVTVQALLGLSLLVAYLTSPYEASTLRTGVTLGLTAIAAGIGGRALHDLRRHFRVAPTPRPDASLVETGVYGRLRHPMYTAVLTLVAAVSLHHPTAWVLLTAALNAVFYLAKARYEEGLLLEAFPGYAAYRRRTWGVVPGL